MFESIVGNENIKNRLSPLVLTGGLGHAVLLLGEDGCGRNAFATELASAYLRDEHGLARRGVHPDMLTLEGSGAMNQITVEAMRSALNELSLSAVTTDGRRVLIIRNAASLNRSSAAALLKTLEEPVPGVLFIITASGERDIIDTVASRCTKYTLSPVDPETCAKTACARTGRDMTECERLSELFSGRLGLVLHYLRNGDSARSLIGAEHFAEAYLQKDMAMMLSLASKPSDRKLASQFWQEVTLYLMREFTKSGDPAILGSIDAIAKMRKELEGNLNLRLFSVKICTSLS